MRPHLESYLLFFLLMEEIWKDIKGFEGLYKVSNLGNVRSVDRVIRRSSTPQQIKGKIIHQGTQNTGYKIVNLWNKKNRQAFLVHRLVAEVFIPKTDLFRNNVDHINGIRIDNRATNLRWCTQKENTNFQIARSKYLKSNKNRIKHLKETKSQTSLQVAQLTPNGEVVKVWDSVKKASEELGILTSGIYASCVGQKITAGGYKWKYTKDLNS